MWPVWTDLFLLTGESLVNPTTNSIQNLPESLKPGSDSQQVETEGVELEPKGTNTTLQLNYITCGMKPLKIVGNSFLPKVAPPLRPRTSSSPVGPTWHHSPVMDLDCLTFSWESEWKCSAVTTERRHSPLFHPPPPPPPGSGEEQLQGFALIQPHGS